MFNIPGLFGMPPAREESFSEQYRCYPVSFHDKAELENGDKILLPATALERLASMTVQWPVMFKLTNTRQSVSTHCGVMEFSAPEGLCFLPYWMMESLLLQEGDMVEVHNVTLPLATFVKLRPRTVDFLDISNPRAVLERSLRSFSAVTKGGQIMLSYNGKRYFLDVLEVRPADAASVIETDMEVDFAPPPGYEEPKRASAAPAASAVAASAPAANNASLAALAAARRARRGVADDFVPFSGSGRRLDEPSGGAPVAAAASSSSSPSRLSSALGGSIIVPTQPATQRSRNKFAQKKKEEAFSGDGKRLQ